MTSAVAPSGSTRFRSAPESISARTASCDPCRAAYISGVQLPSGSTDWPVRRLGTSSSFERALTSAPASTRTRTASGWFSAAAHIKAVSPNQFSRALMSAPALRRAFTTSGRPVRAAVIRIVSPSGSATFGLAPALRSVSVIARLPLIAASASGVMPSRVAALTSALAASSRRVVSRSSARTAQCRRGRPVSLGPRQLTGLLDQRTNARAIAGLDGVDRDGTRSRLSSTQQHTASARRRRGRHLDQASRTVAP